MSVWISSCRAASSAGVRSVQTGADVGAAAGGGTGADGSTAGAAGGGEGGGGGPLSPPSICPRYGSGGWGLPRGAAAGSSTGRRPGWTTPGLTVRGGTIGKSSGRTWGTAGGAVATGGFGLRKFSSSAWSASVLSTNCWYSGEAGLFGSTGSCGSGSCVSAAPCGFVGDSNTSPGFAGTPAGASGAAGCASSLLVISATAGQSSLVTAASSNSLRSVNWSGSTGLTGPLLAVLSAAASAGADLSFCAAASRSAVNFAAAGGIGSASSGDHAFRCQPAGFGADGVGSLPATLSAMVWN